MRTLGAGATGGIFNDGIDTAGNLAKRGETRKIPGAVKKIKKGIVDLVNLKTVIGNQNGSINIIQNQV